jgi:hypothetical protein
MKVAIHNMVLTAEAQRRGGRTVSHSRKKHAGPHNPSTCSGRAVNYVAGDKPFMISLRLCGNTGTSRKWISATKPPTLTASGI